jgi:hypothetical protein
MKRLGFLATVTAGMACTGGIDRSIGLVSEPRILAVRAQPPESSPGMPVSYSALAVTSAGSVAAADVAWSTCAAPAPLTEDSPASRDCIAAAAMPIAVGSIVSLRTPATACRVFGPQGPPALTGQPPSGPVAPDATGGYFQPIKLSWQGRVTIAFERLTCSPIGISLDLAQAYRAARTPNQNPRLAPVVVDLDGSVVDAVAIPAGATVHVSAGWGDDSVERYAMIDIDRGELVWRAEHLWVAWFASGAAPAPEVSDAHEAAATVDCHWRAPDIPGTYALWTVLHDDRGGVDFVETVLGVVRP